MDDIEARKKALEDLSDRLTAMSHSPGDALYNVAAALVGIVPVFSPDKRSLRRKRVEDRWLRDVADVPWLSARGLAVLASAIRSKGWVSLAEARRFIDIEQLAVDDSGHSDSRQPHFDDGAAAILARAGGEPANRPRRRWLPWMS